MASSKPNWEAYRISEVPRGILDDDVKQWFPEEDRQLVLNISHAAAVHSSALMQSSQVFIVTFKTRPESLSHVDHHADKQLLARLLPDLPSNCAACRVDANFEGLTPLNDGSNESTAVDIVAVCGIGGRAFGSWQCEDASMWLRDLLPCDVPSARVFIYGHRLKIRGSDRHNDLMTCTEGLLQDLKAIRPKGSRKPLMLVGHSLGCILAKYMWILCAERSKSPGEDRDLYHAIHSLVFFGAPHNGMHIEDVLEFSQGNPSETLIRELAPGSPTLKSLRERFNRLGAPEHLTVLSCCELRESSTSQRDAQGQIRRDGPAQWLVPEDSACLHWNNGAEIVVPMGLDHSKVAKLSGAIDSKYHVVKAHIVEFAKGATVRVPKRFLRTDAIEAMGTVTRLLAKLSWQRITHSVIGTQLKRQHASSTEYAIAICKLLEDPVLGKALFEDRLTLEAAFAFAETANDLENVLNSWGHSARVPERRKLSKIILETRIRIQALMHMLVFSMFAEPIELSLLESSPFARDIGLPQFAILQQSQERSSSSDEIQIMSPTNGKLSNLANLSSEKAQGLRVARFQRPESDWPSTVIVEYKQYAEALGPRGRPRSETDQKQATAWKQRAQSLATLLNKVPSVSVGNSDDSAAVGSGYGSLDLMQYTFSCIGYLDEPAEGRLALIYDVPSGFFGTDGALADGNGALNWLIEKDNLKRLPVEERFNIALTLCNAVLSLHSSGWVHKNICSGNVVLLKRMDNEGEVGRYDVYLKGFEFSREAGGQSDRLDLSDPILNLYRHPDRQGLPTRSFELKHDLYAIGIVLLEIGTMKTMTQRNSKGLDPGSAEEYGTKCMKLVRDLLPRAMGTRYARAVERCLAADFEVDNDDRIGLALAFRELVIEELAAGVKL